MFLYSDDFWVTGVPIKLSVDRTSGENGLFTTAGLTKFALRRAPTPRLLSYKDLYVHHESKRLCLLNLSLGECVQFHESHTLCVVQSVLVQRFICFCPPFVIHADLVWVARWSTSAFLVFCLCGHMPDGWCVCV